MTDPKLKVNLKEIFGTNVDSPFTRAQIGQAILDKILARTDGSRDVDGKQFKKYSKEYMKSDSFQAFGKSGKVNLRLTGDMLELMDIKDESSSDITVGWNDGVEGSKAHGHITGGGNLPVRDFFGLTNKQVAELKREFQSQVNAEEAPSISQEFLLDAIRRITDGES